MTNSTNIFLKQKNSELLSQNRFAISACTKIELESE